MLVYAMLLNKYYTPALIIITLILTSGCEPVQLFPNEPAIRFVSLSPARIEEGEAFELIFHYQDGDGDLGYNNSERPDTVPYDVFVKDNRANLPPPGSDYTGFPLTLPNLTPQSRNRSIQGDIKVKLEGVYLVSRTDTAETFDFSITLQDRAGNKSNVVKTDKITIVRSE